MSVFQLRTYTLKTAVAASQYAEIWYHHIESLKLFHIETHGVFRPKENDRQVVALVSYADGVDIQTTALAYMSSDAFHADMSGFEMNMIENVQETPLVALPASPLQ
ncbi:NIPSNAP family containing protein [Dickeya undicola]|uniref:NIPSNAP family containing protein n=2 Tax=Dickeya undicola TaxID=1577887 RepID=A0ABX9WP15_9GAMM|nr:NIPSNAP family containing protein [Dickeya undicola]